MNIREIETILIFAVAFGLVLFWISTIPSDEVPRPKPEPLGKSLPTRTLRVLDNAERFVLVSLEPFPPPWRDAESAEQERFHHWCVLGKAEIGSREERTELLQALYQSIVDWNAVSLCIFQPRHGISAKLGDESVELVICFECPTIEVYHDGKLISGVIDDAPKAVFNRALKKANLPLAATRA